MVKEKWTYRLVFELDLSLKIEDRDSVFNGIGVFGKKFNMAFDKPKDLGVKELAYDINSLNKAHFWSLDFFVEKESNFKDFNVFLNREKKVIRYLILKRK